MKKAVLFDLDDTLISEEQYISSGYHKIAEYLLMRYELQTDKEGLFQELCALYQADAKNVFNRMLDAHGIVYAKEDILKLVEIYRSHIPDITFFEDVQPTIIQLKEKNIKLGIISDGYAVTQRNKVKVLQADVLFDKIILTDELGRDYWKPDERAFLMMAEAFHTEFSEMIYVGDNPEKDFYIGKDYPILTVRIKREHCVYRDREYRDNIKEKAAINTLTELLTLL